MASGLGYSILIVVLLLSPWTVRIAFSNPLLLLALILQTVLLNLIHKKRNPKISFLLFLLLIISVLLYLPQSFDLSLFVHTPEEIFKINQRRQYYDNLTGRLFQNKLSLSVNKFETNLFQILDPNMYFFASHPRERVGVKEFSKFHFLFIPIFLIGFFSLIKDTSKTIFIYAFFTIAISTLVKNSAYLGPVFVFPLIVSVLYIGTCRLILRNET